MNHPYSKDNPKAEHKFDERPHIYWVPSQYDFVLATLDAICETKPDDVFYDLGCGDGRVCIEVAKRFGIRCVGVDADKKRVNESNINIAMQGLHRKVNIIWENIYDVDLTEATIVYMYLLDPVVRHMVPVLNKKEGIRVFTKNYHPFYRDEDNQKQYYSPVKFHLPYQLHEYITPIDQVHGPQFVIPTDHNWKREKCSQ